MGDFGQMAKVLHVSSGMADDKDSFCCSDR